MLPRSSNTIVLPSGDTSSDSHVPSSVVNSILRSRFSGSFLSLSLSSFLSSFLSLSWEYCEVGSSVLCASVAARLPSPPNPASTIAITASHRRTQALFCFKTIPQPPICVAQQIDDQHPPRTHDQTRLAPSGAKLYSATLRPAIARTPRTQVQLSRSPETSREPC